MAKGKNDKKDNRKPPKVSNEVYEAEMFRLQTELVKLQEWTKITGAGSWCSSKAATPPARVAPSSGSASTLNPGWLGLRPADTHRT